MPVSFLRVVLVLAGLLICGGARAASSDRLPVERLPVDGALTQNTVSDIVQDRSGLIWFATLGGVNVYDGYAFRSLDADPRDPGALAGVAVSDLFEDRDGAIWIGGFMGWLDR